MEKERLIYLLEQYANNADSPAERVELQYFLDDAENRELFTEVVATLIMQHKDAAFDASPYVELSDRVLEMDQVGDRAVERSAVSHRPVRRRWYWPAAAIFLILVVGGYFVLNQKAAREVPIVNNATNIIAPQSNRAMVTLANGKKIFLDSLGNGQLVQQGNVKLVKLQNGQIAYQTAAGKVLPHPQYNTLVNPRGSEVVNVQLADGSHVWLNAGSSLTYPVTFTGSERKVRLKGEGYFEVVRDQAREFTVSSGALKIEVLGTHFNVNAYVNESAIKVTLLEGLVRTRNRTKSVLIKPGEQAVSQDGTVTINRSPDLDQVMAWKNGYFSFNGLTLKEAMIQLERWYDIDVVYDGKVDDIELVGKMTRDIPLNGLMDILQKLGVKYQLEGRTLIIKE